MGAKPPVKKVRVNFLVNNKSAQIEKTTGFGLFSLLSADFCGSEDNRFFVSVNVVFFGCGNLGPMIFSELSRGAWSGKRLSLKGQTKEIPALH
ncbi:MAG: hypothetical protein F4X91_01365 [Nitrospinae bacterium]|nr:hypothetical protein [Nitrospinota bacterium]